MTKATINIINEYGEVVDQKDVVYKTELELIQIKEELAKEIQDDWKLEVAEDVLVEVPENVLTTAASYKSIRKLSNKSYNVTFNIQTLTPEKLVQIDGLDDSNGVFLYKPVDKISEKDILALSSVDTDMYQGKTPSKRLYNVLYVWFNESPQGFNNFADFYLHFMEKFISHVKDKLPK